MRGYLSSAAINQLQTVGKQLDVPVYSEGDQVKPQQIVENALKHAKEEHLDFVIIDTKRSFAY